VLLSIVLFYNIMKKDRGVLLYTMYTAALAAACHTYYWGLIAVLPSHIVATFLMRREVKSWHRALVCQLAAASTALIYIFAIATGFNKQSGGQGLSVYQLLYFGTILVDFSSITWGWLDFSELPSVAIVSTIVLAVVLRGAWRWIQGETAYERWLGFCLLGSFLLLLIVYLLGRSTMSVGPLLRRFALLQIPLLFSFLYGLSQLSRPVLGHLIFWIWLTCTATFSFKFIASDYYRGSQLMAQKLSGLPA